MSRDTEGRFGMPDSAFRAASESHGTDNHVVRAGMYVPFERDIAELDPDTLHAILIDWMWESPSELIPSNEQIAAVKELLLARPDANSSAIQGTVAACNDFLGE